MTRLKVFSRPGAFYGQKLAVPFEFASPELLLLLNGIDF